MVNGNPPYQEAIKPLTIFYEKKPCLNKGLRNTTLKMIVEVRIVFSYRDDKVISWR